MISMARALKHVDLELEEDLFDRLREEAERRHLSLPELVRAMLVDDLGRTRDPRGTAQRIRQLRKSVGPMPDSTPVIRSSRDQGW